MHSIECIVTTTASDPFELPAGLLLTVLMVDTPGGVNCQCHRWIK